MCSEFELAALDLNEVPYVNSECDYLYYVGSLNDYKFTLLLICVLKWKVKSTSN